jgi:transposase
MDKIRKQIYTREFRAQAVKQVLQGDRKPAEVAKALDINIKTFSRWLMLARGGRLAEVDGHRAEPVSEMQAEISRLKRELAEAREDRDILKKASAYFAKHLK